MKVQILLIEDDKNFVNTLRLLLRSHPIEIFWAATGAEGIREYRKHQLSLATVIIDYCLPDLKGSEVGLTIKKINPSQDILFASGFRDPENLIDLLETGGARSFLYKDRPVEEIKARILDSISIYEKSTRIIGLDEYSPGTVEQELKAEGFVGRSPKMQQMLSAIRQCREQNFSTLIIGETGTGKELVAQALTPKDKHLIVVDCPRYSKSENLLESDLFGHVKGAFTGAERDKPGLLAEANGHVVFLDELHQLSIEAQSKLLRFLQEMKYRRLGDSSGRETKINFKLIAAAKPEIFDKIKDGSFLEDLLHRVNRLEISVPPLRDRLDDLEPLVRHFQAQFNEGKSLSQHKQIRAATMARMAALSWSGNIRQLQNIVARLLTMTSTDTVNPSDLERILATDSQERFGIPLQESSDKLERTNVIAALAQSKNKSEAASVLGITRWTLNRIVERLGIQPERYLLLPANK
jgi:two-component system response regulator AtoC